MAEALEGSGADVLGLNCSVGPAAMLEAMERMAAVHRRPLSAQPNAGLPRTVGDRKIYLASPEYMARYARRLIDAGVRFVGGCCGTTPDHVQRIAEAVAGHPAPPPRRPGGEAAAPKRAPPASPVPLAERSALGPRLASGRASWPPWRSCRPGGGTVAAGGSGPAGPGRRGVDAVNIVDWPRARSRMALHPRRGRGPQREVGIETVVHYTCRDRNMMGMISDLLGAAAAGLRNLLLVSGDPPARGPTPTPPPSSTSTPSAWRTW